MVFEQGDLGFSPPWPAAIAVVAVLVAMGASVWVDSRSARTTNRSRAALLALRLSALAVFLFALLRPVLVVRTVEAQRNVLAVLVDGSRSMAVADLDAKPRSAFVRDALGASGALRTALASRFSIRDFEFASTARRAGDPAAMTFSGSRSFIGRSLQRTAEELAGLPVSGIVLVTDGADTSREPMADAIRALKSAGLPVFAVGLGREALDKDVQIGRVDPPATVLKGATLVTEVVISQSGYAGRTVPLVVEDEGQVIASQDVTLPPDGEPSAVRVRFTLAEPGPRVLSFRIGTQDGEQVTQNNARQALVTVKDRRERVLYVEGEPRFEMKFLRRAAAGDANLQVVMLQRTADRKFLRLDIDASDDLAGGFPEDARRTVRLPGPGAGQHRGRGLYGRPAAHDRRLREPARRRPAGARRAPRLRGRGLRGDGRRRRPPGAAGRRQSGRRLRRRDQGEPDAPRPDPRRHADRRHRAAVGGTVGRAAGADHGEPGAAREARRGGIAGGQERVARRRAGGARVPALRRGQGPGHARAGLVDVADARHRAGRGPDARDAVAAAAALARRRRARAGQRVASIATAWRPATPSP